MPDISNLNTFRLRRLLNSNRVECPEQPEFAAILVLLFAGSTFGKLAKSSPEKRVLHSRSTIRKELELVNIEQCDREHDDEIASAVEQLADIGFCTGRYGKSDIVPNATCLLYGRQLNARLQEIAPEEPSEFSMGLDISKFGDWLLKFIVASNPRDFYTSHAMNTPNDTTDLMYKIDLESLALEYGNSVSVERIAAELKQLETLDLTGHFLDKLETEESYTVELTFAGIQRGQLLAQMSATPQLSSISTGVGLAPASDRIVNLDHNRPNVNAIRTELDRLYSSIEGINDPDLVSDESKELYLVDLELVRKIFTAKRITIGAITTIVLPILYGVGSKLQDALSTEIAQHLISLIKSVAGM